VQTVVGRKYADAAVNKNLLSHRKVPAMRGGGGTTFISSANQRTGN